MSPWIPAERPKWNAHTISLNTESAPKHPTLEASAAQEYARLTTVRQRQRSITSPVAELLLARIDDEELPHEVETLVAAARASADEALAAQQRILDLRVAIDAVEDELQWPELVDQAEVVRIGLREKVQESGNAHDKVNLPAYEEAIDKAIAARDGDLLRQRTDELRQQMIRVLDRGPDWQILVFQSFAANADQLSNPQQAERLLAEGMRALDEGRPEQLRIINPQLRAHMPDNTPAGGPQGADPFSTVELFR